MTTVLSQEDLREMCKQHTIYLHDPSCGERADFSHMDLSDLYISHENLTDALFEHTIMPTHIHDSKFNGAIFANAKFDSINIKNSHFYKCSFTHAMFAHCLIESSSFEQATLPFTGFNTTTIYNTNFDLTSFDYSVWVDCELKKVKFHCTSHIESRIADSILNAVSFVTPNLKAASLEHLSCIDLTCTQDTFKHTKTVEISLQLS